VARRVRHQIAVELLGEIVVLDLNPAHLRWWL
jgi:hypothetical protein